MWRKEFAVGIFPICSPIFTSIPMPCVVSLVVGIRKGEEDYEGIIENRITIESQKLRFLSCMQMKYRHFTIRDLETYDDSTDPESGRCRRNRVICYSDGKGFDHRKLIEDEINWEGFEVSFVSFRNECILSVYDDRGCDVVFMTHEKLKNSMTN